MWVSVCICECVLNEATMLTLHFIHQIFYIDILILYGVRSSFLYLFALYGTILKQEKNFIKQTLCCCCCWVNRSLILLGKLNPLFIFPTESNSLILVNIQTIDKPVHIQNVWSGKLFFLDITWQSVEFTLCIAYLHCLGSKLWASVWNSWVRMFVCVVHSSKIYQFRVYICIGLMFKCSSTHVHNNTNIFFDSKHRFTYWAHSNLFQRHTNMLILSN